MVESHKQVNTQTETDNKPKMLTDALNERSFAILLMALSVRECATTSNLSFRFADSAACITVMTLGVYDDAPGYISDIRI